MLNGFVVATDHEAVAALEPPHATAGAAVDEVDSSCLQIGVSGDVVAVVRVPPVDDDVARLQHADELVDDFANHGCGHHHPHCSRCRDRRGELLEGTRALDALLLECNHGIVVHVERDTVMSVCGEAPDDVGAHAPQSDHS